MSKVLITGTGRAGTSFLVHLLSALGFDTGYTEEQCAEICNNSCQAGAEHTIEKPYYILKNPYFMEDMESIVKEYDIEHVIIPIRDLYNSAKSRENNSENHGGFGGFVKDVDTVNDQIFYNAYHFYNMIECLERNEIRYTTISFPLMVNDYEYLLERLDECFFNMEIDKDEFELMHRRIANPNKITIK